MDLLRARVASRGGAAPPARVPGPARRARRARSRRVVVDETIGTRVVATRGVLLRRRGAALAASARSAERSSRKTENDADTSDTSVRAYVRRVPFVDLYAVLAVDPAASTAQINASWKRLQKAVHPDVAGAYAETAAALLNEARAVLVRPIDRDAHDSDRAEWLKRGGTDRDLFSVFAAEPLSAWSGRVGGPRKRVVAFVVVVVVRRIRRRRSIRDARRLRIESNRINRIVDASLGVFVDESQCIGCVQCATTAPNTFRAETRSDARAVDQWADGADAVADAVRRARCGAFTSWTPFWICLFSSASRRGCGKSAAAAASAASPPNAPAVMRPRSRWSTHVRRRADRKTGLAPWPSRRRRAAVSVADARGGVDTSSAAAAVAAAVRAANAAEAAAAETSGLARGVVRGRGRRSADGRATRVFLESAAYGRRVSPRRFRRSPNRRTPPTTSWRTTRRDARWSVCTRCFATRTSPEPQIPEPQIPERVARRRVRRVRRVLEGAGCPRRAPISAAAARSRLPKTATSRRASGSRKSDVRAGEPTAKSRTIADDRERDRGRSPTTRTRRTRRDAKKTLPRNKNKKRFPAL